MVLVPLDINDPQPRRDDERFGGDYKAFRKADKAWSERERIRRKRLKVAEPTNAELPPTAEPPAAEPPTVELPTVQPVQPPTAQPPTAQMPSAQPPTTQPPTDQPPTAQTPSAQPPLFRKPHGRVPMAFGEQCQWDAVCGCWRDAAGVEWDRLRAGRAELRREQEQQERERVAAEAQAKRQEEEQECYRLRFEKGERKLQEHVEQGARWRARDMAKRRNRLAQLQGSEAAQNAEAGSVAVACGVRAVAEENPEWRRIQATYHWSCIPCGVP